MMNVYLKAYLKKNLGDDLFVKIITDRYPNTNFYSFSLNNYSEKCYNSNLKVASGIKIKLEKALQKISRGKYRIERRYIKDTDSTILIGGSMFIQYKNFLYSNMLEHYNNKKYYIIGTNFGPYNTEEYKKSVKYFLKDAEDVCFRDQYSYECFKELANIRYSPDIVFSMNTDEIMAQEKKEVFISVIDCNKKFSQKETEKYEELIINIIRLYINKGYKIILGSFCKDENDEIAVKRIVKKCSENEKKYIEKYFYRGNLNEALKKISEAKIIVGTRFHANVVGLLLNKTIIPIIYSNKTKNMLNDINFKGRNY